MNHKIIFPEIQAEFIAKQRVLAGHFQWGKLPDSKCQKIVEPRTEYKFRAALSHSLGVMEYATYRYVTVCSICAKVNERCELAPEAKESAVAILRGRTSTM